VDVALAVLRRGDAVLLQRRTAPPFEGLWELPGGKVLPGEPPADAALREASEELGIRGTAVRLLVVHEHRYPGGPWVRLHVFEVEAAEPRVTADRAWVRPADAATWDVLEGTRPILAALARDTAQKA